MNTAFLTPYIMFSGNCREAMEFYKSCMDGKLTMMTFGEAPMPCPESEKNKIMHASLDNETLSFMGCDSPEKTVMGDNVQISVGGTDEARLKKMFKDLSAGGKVTMDLTPQFWGDTFGILTDKFGIHWMFNITAKKA